MLYERWCEIAAEYRNEIALQDVAMGEHWTFGQLAKAAEKVVVSDPVDFPQGRDFILTLLAAWRMGKIACPLEIGQEKPLLGEPLPKCDHLKMTSATAGVSRMIAFTGEQLAADAENIVATMGLRREWPNLGVISLAHSYGFSNLVLPLLIHGIPLILMDSPLPETLRRASAISSSITLAAVPALWRTWYEANAIPSNVGLAISAGAPLSLKLEDAVFAKHGLKIHNFYGSSECGGIAYDDSAAPRREFGCVGTPMKNVQLSIAEDGCLEVGSKAVGISYWPKGNENLRDGCFHTSDLVEINEGVVYMRGRAGDQINVAGRKISPEIIETALLSHAAVADCLVFGIPSKHEERKEAIVACVVSKGELDGDALRQFLSHKLPAWQIPREWLFVKSLEANQRGKLSRNEWRKRYLSSKVNGEAS